MIRPVDTLIGAGVRTLRLPAIDRRRKLEAAVELTRASLELRLVPSSRTASLLGTLQGADGRQAVSSDELREAGRVGLVVAAAARRLPWRPTCLRQALAVRRMLRRRGIGARLHIGVTDASVGEAHAWVTVDGNPVIGRPGLERFVPIAAFG
jgi:hypothetical protein